MVYRHSEVLSPDPEAHEAGCAVSSRVLHDGQMHRVACATPQDAAAAATECQAFNAARRAEGSLTRRFLAHACPARTCGAARSVPLPGLDSGRRVLAAPSAGAAWTFAGVFERTMVAGAVTEALQLARAAATGLTSMDEIVVLARALEQAVATAPAGLAICLDYVAAQLLEQSQLLDVHAGSDWLKEFVGRLIRSEKQQLVAALKVARWADGPSAMTARRLFTRAQALVM
jgi:hypothetical protein